MNYKATMASARVFFSKRRRQQRNGFINDEIPVVENGYDPQESEEDEVFVQDPNMELSASKPLMHPRSKVQRGAKVHTRTLESCRICSLCKPVFYFVALVTVLCAVMATIVYIANRHEGAKTSAAGLENSNGDLNSDATSWSSLKETAVLIGCDTVDVEDVWVVGFPKLLTESALRLVDVDGDGSDDVILGFATGADGHGVSPIVCDLYFGGERPCLGGVMAVEGRTGNELWRRYTDHEIYGLNCQYDLNKDGVRDCLAAGRAGTLVSVSGKDGTLLWSLGRQSRALNPLMNVYTPQYIQDVNGDGVPDVIVVHGGDPLQKAGSKHRLSARILLLSGKDGVVMRWVGVPDGRESYYSPQIVDGIEGSLVLLFGTGGESHNGSLWRVEVDSLLKGKIDRAVKISSDSHKGFMTPPALADVTKDQTPDILVPSFNSTLLAIDGKNFQPLWSVHFPSSESYSTPAVGYYNDDDVPDLVVKYAHGPGFPVYYYSETTVIDGKTGAKLIDPPLRDTMGSQASPLTIAMEGLGNDLFLVWMADCKGHEGATDQFTFTKDTSQTDKSKSDLCSLRFKSEEMSRLLVVGRNLPKGGIPVYQSDTRKAVEHSQWVNTSAQAYEYVMKHPEILDDYNTDSWRPVDIPSTPVRDQNSERGYYSNLGYTNTHSSGSKKGPQTQTRTRLQENSGKINNNNNNNINNNNDISKGYNPSYSSFNRGSSRLSPPSRNNNPYGDSMPLKQPQYYQNNIAGDSDYEFPYADNSGTYGNLYGTYLNNDENLYPSYPNRYSSSSPSRRRGSRRRGRKRRKVFSGNYAPNKHIERRRILQRLKRHVGPHDNDGVQRLISTGTLVPPLLPLTHPEYNTSMDVIFATYWSYPSHVDTILLSKDQQCISDRMAKEGVARFDADGPYYQMSHDQYEETVTIECLELSRGESVDGHQDTFTASDSEYNPFNLNMGQMTLYRIRIKLSCSSTTANQTDTTKTRCATVLPFAQQKWSAYMGSNGDSYWSVPNK